MKFFQVAILGVSAAGNVPGTIQVFNEEQRAKAYKADLLKAGHQECDVWLTTVL